LTNSPSKGLIIYFQSSTTPGTARGPFGVKSGSGDSGFVTIVVVAAAGFFSTVAGIGTCFLRKGSRLGLEGARSLAVSAGAR
jgi:hypothetical protein